MICEWKAAGTEIKGRGVWSPQVSCWSLIVNRVNGASLCTDTHTQTKHERKVKSVVKLGKLCLWRRWLHPAFHKHQLIVTSLVSHFYFPSFPFFPSIKHSFIITNVVKTEPSEIYQLNVQLPAALQSFTVLLSSKARLYCFSSLTASLHSQQAAAFRREATACERLLIHRLRLHTALMPGFKYVLREDEAAPEFWF